MNTKSTDIIIVAPSSIDYPVFRKFLKNVYMNFNKIHYVFTINKDLENKFNYKSFIKNYLCDSRFVYDEVNMEVQGDWRNVATNLALDKSESDNILFIEPDFKINQNVLYELPEKDLIGFYEPITRIWPSFLYVKRSLINLTERNFSSGMFNKIYTLSKESGLELRLNELIDHFGKFISDVLLLTKDYYFLNENNISFLHYAGITHNFNLCRYRYLNLIHNPKVFLQYMIDNKDPELVLDDVYLKETEEYMKLIKDFYNL
jgi:hypothetical protein